MTHPLLVALNSEPINRQARRVTSQKGCATVETDLTRDELKHILARMKRKQELMKLVLRIKTKSQHDNTIKNYNAGQRSRKRPRRLVEEYVLNGLSIERVARRLHEIKNQIDPPELRAARQLVGAIEEEWKQQHPGSIWDGKQRVAPNGDTFRREEIMKGLKP